MTTARIKSPGTGVASRQHPKRYHAKLVSSGAATRKVKGVQIRLRYRTLKTLAHQRGRMKALIETYGAAVEKSRLMGVSFRQRCMKSTHHSC